MTRSSLTRRGLLTAGLGGAALWAGHLKPSAAISFRSSPAATASRPILAWTDLTLALIQETKPSPPRAARALALVHVAMADAARAAIPATPAAISDAAATVLGQLFPRAASQIAAQELAVTRSLSWSRTHPRHTGQFGLDVGRRIGEEVIAWGQADGSDARWDGKPLTGAGTWQPTPPDYRQDPIEPLAGQWRPWVLPSGDALRPAPPPAWGTPVWEAELLAVREAVARRTPEQAAAVQYWAGGPGTVTPAGLWITIARDLIVRDGLDALAAAQVLALTSIAMVDGFICCWDAKYAYWMARPITADPTLDALISTPPFPSYTSGHATISAAAATVLSHFFPGDAPSLLQQSVEAKNSRLWGGIHYPIDNEMGALGGGVIGRLVIARAAETGVAWDRIRASTTPPVAAPVAERTGLVLTRLGMKRLPAPGVGAR